LSSHENELSPFDGGGTESWMISHWNILINDITYARDFYKQNKLFPVFYKSLKWKEKLSCMTLINSVWYHCYCIFIRDYRFIIMFSIKEVDITSLWLSKEIYRRLYFSDNVHVCIEIVLTTCLNSLIILFDSVQTYLICNKDLWYTCFFLIQILMTFIKRVSIAQRPVPG
jgi:hypothetical protein